MSTPPSLSPTIALLSVARRTERELSEGLRPLGLTIRQYGLLGHIRSSPGVSFSELARRSGVSAPSAHTMVGTLSRSGLVVDSTAHSGSPSRLAVTDEGISLLDRAALVRADVDARLRVEFPELCRVLDAMTLAMMNDREH